MARVRGGRVSMIYQDPMSSLNPLQPVGRQVAEAIAAHEDVSGREARGAHGRDAPGRRVAAAGATLRRLPAPVLGRHAAAGDDRDGDRHQPGRADRRRAHHRPRRDHPGADHGAARPHRRRARDGRDPDHARSRPRVLVLRGHARDVRRPDRRERRCSGRAAHSRVIPTPRRSWSRFARSTGTSTGRSQRSRASRRCPTSCRPAARSTRAARMRRMSAPTSRRRRSRSMDA